MEFDWFYDEGVFDKARKITNEVLEDSEKLKKKYMWKFKNGENGKKVLEEYTNEITKIIEKRSGMKSNNYYVDIKTNYVEILKNEFGTYICVDKTNISRAIRDIFGFGVIRAILPVEAVVITSLITVADELDVSYIDDEKIHFLFLGGEWIFLMHHMIKGFEERGELEGIYKKFGYDCVVLPHFEHLPDLEDTRE